MEVGGAQDECKGSQEASGREAVRARGRYRLEEEGPQTALALPVREGFVWSE